MGALVRLVSCLTSKPTFFKCLFNISLEEDDGHPGSHTPVEPISFRTQLRYQPCLSEQVSLARVRGGRDVNLVMQVVCQIFFKLHSTFSH